MFYGAVLVGWLVLGLAATEFRATVVPAAVAKYRATVATRSIIGNYLGGHPLHKLQIGAGTNNMPGWLNTDIEPSEGQAYLDATRRFPLPDSSFDYIFTEHVVEHLAYEDGLRMFQECYRVLAPGGKLRIATPNLLKFIELFQAGRGDEAQRYLEGKIKWHNWPQTSSPECLILNLQLRSWGHQFVYDPRMLEDALARSGFQKIVRFRCGESDDPELKGIESRHKSGIGALNDYETMVFQAVRM